MCHYADLGSASDWWKQISHVTWPIRSTTQIWVVLLIGGSKFPMWHDQSEALPRSESGSENGKYLHSLSLPLCLAPPHVNKLTEFKDCSRRLLKFKIIGTIYDGNLLFSQPGFFRSPFFCSWPPKKQRNHHHHFLLHQDFLLYYTRKDTNHSLMELFCKINLITMNKRDSIDCGVCKPTFWSRTRDIFHLQL